MTDKAEPIATDTATGKELYKTASGYMQAVRRNGKLCDPICYKNMPSWAVKKRGLNG